MTDDHDNEIPASTWLPSPKPLRPEPARAASGGRRPSSMRAKALASIAGVLLLVATIAAFTGGDGSSPHQSATRTATADGVPDARDPAPNIESIRTRADAAAAKRAERDRAATPEQQAQDRAKANAEQRRAHARRDRAIERAQSFFIAMDDNAIALDDAIAAALDSEPGAAAKIAAVRERITRRNESSVLRGDDPSVGANLLLSAATSAREAARRGDQHALVVARREEQKARNKLAAEIAG